MIDGRCRSHVSLLRCARKVVFADNLRPFVGCTQCVDDAVDYFSLFARDLSGARPDPAFAGRTRRVWDESLGKELSAVVGRADSLRDVRRTSERNEFNVSASAG